MGFRLLLVAVLEALQETEIHKLSYFKGILEVDFVMLCPKI